VICGAFWSVIEDILVTDRRSLSSVLFTHKGTDLGVTNHFVEVILNTATVNSPEVRVLQYQLGYGVVAESLIS
jgi:hypothetical protein